jgi:trans-aconitate methyltransferase
MARSPKSGYSSIYDLGCGTGHLTRILADTFSNSEVTGIDSSPEMLAEARCDFPRSRGSKLTSARGAQQLLRISSIPTPPCNGFLTTKPYYPRS